MSTYYIADAIKKLANNFKEVEYKIEREKFEFEKMKFKQLSQPEQQSEQQVKECEHDWLFNGSMLNSAGEHLYYKCLKCGATKLICNGVTYESGVKWQP